MPEQPADWAAWVVQVNTQAGMLPVEAGGAAELLDDWAATRPASRTAKAKDFMVTERPGELGSPAGFYTSFAFELDMCPIFE